MTLSNSMNMVIASDRAIWSQVYASDSGARASAFAKDRAGRAQAFSGSARSQRKYTRNINKVIAQNAVDKGFLKTVPNARMKFQNVKAIQLSSTGLLLRSAALTGGAYIVGNAIGKKLVKNSKARNRGRQAAARAARTGGTYQHSTLAKGRTNHAVRPGRPRRGGHGAHGKRQQRDSRGRFS